MKSEQQAASPVESDNQCSDVASKRRQFVRRGVIGAPVLLALKSTPVLATVANCKQPSGFSVSGNFSQTHGNTCGAPAPGPSSLVNDPLKVKLFVGNTNSGDAGLTAPTSFPPLKNAGNYTLGDALAGATTDAALIAAAYINAKNSNFFGVLNTTVRAMWNNTASGGTYIVPSTGVTWSRSDVIKYLKYAMAV
jgi:hypothetical protein